MEEKDIMKIIRPFLLRVTVCCILLILMYIGYFYFKRKMLMKHEFFNQPAYGNIVYQIESMAEENGKVVVEGFAFEKAVDSNNKGKNVVLLLHDLKTNKNIYMNTRSVIRQDVNDYFKCEYDFSNSGFHATVKKELIDLENGKYQFYLQYFTSTEVTQYAALEEYLIDGELCCVNTSEIKGFHFEGTELEEFFQGAKLRVCRPDVGICVYQKGGELYWVADENFSFLENGKTYIPFQMYTTQVERLPEERLKNHLYWSDIGFYFENNEICGDYGRFRVARAELPTEYSVTDMFTGDHDGNDWIWIQYFFMDYGMLWNVEK